MEEGGKSRGTLRDDLGALLSSGVAADVTIMAGSVWLPAHRVIMAARSPVFAAMFRHDLLEASNNSVSITDINQEVMRQMLHFMYTDEAPLLECFGAELLAAADKYNVPRLKQQCEQQLIQDLCMENAADCAVLAMVYSCEKLKAAAISFISSHCKEVMATDRWANAMRQHTEDTVKICRLLGEAERLELECEKESERSAAVEDVEGRLVSDLLVLLESGEGSDVTLMVGGASLAAHRAVLAARSPILAELLKDSPGGTLRVDGVREEELRQVLLYMYSDQQPPPASVTDKLLVLSDNYALCGLKEYCEEQLEHKITIDSAMLLAVVAIKHSCSSLKRTCVDFIRTHIFQVMDTAGWDAAVRDDAEVVLQITKSIARAVFNDKIKEIRTNICITANILKELSK
ncbi:BTB/POZ domain-containing protein 6-B-like [Schistocerca nitens]|uniref:BTB/POZ domain-containing protein 6-B-like n=1 Tax=Schistocerca nitens TaxID=7011 RepID=UPI00211843CE|nr:BTB/POZ domain-containing protein 6-B-like [Schistocerca nitens]